jgi:oxalate decarboxylase
VWLGAGNARTFDFEAGDTAVFPDNSGNLTFSLVVPVLLYCFSRMFYPLTSLLGHYVENTHPTETLCYLEIFKADTVKDIGLQQWLSLTPPDLVAQILNVSLETVKSFRPEKGILVMGED